MNLRTIIRPFHDAAQIEGTVTDQMRTELERAVRGARLELARRQTWTEIPEPVRRGRFLVDVDSDRVFMLRQGVVFEPGKATIGFVPDNAQLTYFVDREGRVVFLESAGRRTWTEICEHEARRK